MFLKPVGCNRWTPQLALSIGVRSLIRILEGAYRLSGGEFLLAPAFHLI